MQLTTNSLRKHLLSFLLILISIAGWAQDGKKEKLIDKHVLGQTSLEENNKKLVDKLILNMTTEEKVAQLIGTGWKDWFKDGKLANSNLNKISSGIGNICQFACMSDLTLEQHKESINEVQKYLIDQTRLGIPALFHEEATCGLAARGATSFPQQLGMGCTWNPELIRKNTATIRELMSKVGARFTLAPNLDINRNTHWGRIEETYGEDPYLTSLLGLAYIQSMQTKDLRNGVAVTLKHFAGYGDGGAALQEPWIFREESLRPYEVAIRYGQAQAAMCGYHLFNKLPCAASKELLTDILRGQLGFDGLVVSDYGAIDQITDRYHLANNYKEAAVQAILAGTDIDFPSGSSFRYLPEMINKGVIPMQTLNKAVERILMLKARLGILNKKASDLIPVGEIVGDPKESRKLAYQSACQSIVLLKNKGILPFNDNIKSIAVVGPNANSPESLNGDYSHQTLAANCANIPIRPDDPQLVTLLDGIKAKTSTDKKIVFHKGCTWTGPVTINADSLKLISDCDLIIVAVGENKDLCGEGHDRSDARLPGAQEELIRTLAALGKPVVLVYLGGRPPVLTNVEPYCSAIVCAWYPGEEGGNAMADLLLGNINPSGKLSTTLPRSNEQCPIAYEWGYNPDDMPLYPFGHGLSYTTYVYDGFRAPSTINVSQKEFPVTFTVKNTGTCKGVEIAQLYIVPLDIKAPHPKQMLRGFARIELNPGEKKNITINISPQTLAFYNKDMKLFIESGKYELLLGASSTDIKAKAVITLSGKPILLNKREVFFNESNERIEKSY
jgi:beta-glucosidase